MLDPRLYQLLFLSLLLAYGDWFRGFEVLPSTILIVTAAALVTQALFIWRLRLSWKGLLSAGITALSLLLLLRANHFVWLACAAALAISSKFVLRFRNKHFFNPATFAIVVGLLTGKAWVSPAQWGEGVLMAFWFLGAGLIVVTRARSASLSVVFLATHLLLLAGRVVYLGQPRAVFGHQLETGSLLLFTFFMISDPRSTPDHLLGKISFAILAAVATFWIRFELYDPNALFLALFLVSPLAPWLDRVWRAPRFNWPDAPFSHRRRPRSLIT